LMINYILLISRQGKVRLAKWYATMPNKTKANIIRDITQLVLSRKPKMCNVLEYKGIGVVYRRYASLFFIAEIESIDNELTTLEVLHRYVEVLDNVFGNVRVWNNGVDRIFNFRDAYLVLDELILGGEMQETSKSTIVKSVSPDSLFLGSHRSKIHC
ncbi:AP-1 complex subunit sigma-1, partial [Leucoagaricus sp. SymC.cos]